MYHSMKILRGALLTACILTQAFFSFGNSTEITCSRLTIENCSLSIENNPSDTTRTRIYLIGDTGKKAIISKNYKQFSRFISADTPSCILYLGDNVYPKGIRPTGDKHHDTDVEKMKIQLRLLKNHRGQVYMVPGNHDWQMGKTKGLEYVKRESDLVNQYIRDSLTQYTEEAAHYFKYAGFAGPEKVELEGITLIMVDTDWWVHKQLTHPVGLIDNSKKKTEALFFQQFDAYLKEASEKGQKIAIVTHHPLYLTGANSLKMQPTRFLITYTPLKVFGMMGMNRAARGMSPQPNYKRMVSKFEKHIAPYKNIIWISGHDHDQQLIIKNNVTQIVSGNGGEFRKVDNRDKMAKWYNDDTMGFSKIELSKNGIVQVFFYDDEGRELYKEVINNN
jgi:predicted MPP superfamily phosphohydrolase